MIVQKIMQKAVSRIVKDFKQKELIPLKILFFVQATTIAVLYPYLTIHMRELGISIEETAIMSAMIPVIGILMPPLAGMLADKIGNFKLLLFFSSLIGGVTALLLLVVPPAKIRSEYPQELVFDFGCNLGHPDLKLTEYVPCEGKMTNSSLKDMKLRLENCGLACNQSTSTMKNFLQNEESIVDQISKAMGYSFKIETGNTTRSVTFNLSGDEDPSLLMRRISGGYSYYFPSRGLYQLHCKEVTEHAAVCYIGGLAEDIETADDGIKKERALTDIAHLRNMTWTLYNEGNNTVRNFEYAACVNPHKKQKEVVTVSVYLNDQGMIELSKCEARCLVMANRKEICSNSEFDIVRDPQLTFWVYFFVRVLIGITGSTTYSMFEVAVISILREQKADYGLQRIYATLGVMVASPLSGYLIDYASEGKLAADYSPAFYLYGGLKVVSALLVLLINLEFKTAAKSVIADFIQVMKNAEVLCLMASCFVLGSAWGYIESFLFWFLEDLGGNRSLMGITVTVGGLAGIPLLIFSGPIVNKIGHANVIFIGFIFYAIRLLGYSLIHNPYHCLYFEAMESITSSLAITAAITYAAKLSTTTTDGSIQGLVGGLYYGVGKGAGTLIGGYLTKSFGMRETFQIFAAFTIAIGIVYFLFNQFYIRKLPNRENNDICKKEPKKVEDDIKVVMVKGAELSETEKTKTEKPQKMEEDHENEGYVPTEEDGEGRPKDVRDQSEDSQTVKTKEE